MPQLLNVLLKRAQVQTLLDDGPDSSDLQVKHVLCIPDQCSHAGIEVRALRVGHGLKMLLPHRVLLVMNRKESDWHPCSVGEAALTQGGECDLCRLLNGLIQLNPDDGCHPWLHWVEGYRHATAVDRNIPIVAELAECVVQYSREPWAMLARGAKTPILSDGDMGVVVHVHLKTQP
jgi:hypothetical protein